MLAALLIVLREVLEAGLVVGIVMAATRGVPGRGLMVSLGIAGGVLGACVVATFASRISGLFAGGGQEVFNAAVLGLAVVMLAWHNTWMAQHGREIAAEMRAVGRDVASGSRPLTALAVVVGVAVLREGSEVALFLYGVAVQGGSTGLGMLTGGALGLAGGAALGALLYGGLVAVPTRQLFKVTGLLITLLAAGMAAQAVDFLQQGGIINAGFATVWDSSALLAQDSMLGRALHALVGYTDRPSQLQLAAYLLTVGVIVALGRYARSRAVPPKAAGGAVPRGA
jgi:high-affinity iron transporter